MCNFLSQQKRSVTLTAGATRKIQGCFLEHAEVAAQRQWGAAKKVCLFHEQAEPVFLTQAGAGPAQEFDTKLTSYMSSQSGRYSTLDLCGIHIKYINGSSPFKLLGSLEPDERTFREILLSEATIFCPVELSDIYEENLTIYLDNARLCGGLRIAKVRCSAIVLSNSSVDPSRISISDLTCGLLDLRGVSLTDLTITNSQIGTLDLTDTELVSLTLVDTVIGNSQPGKPAYAPPGLQLSSRTHHSLQTRDLEFRRSTVSGRFDLTNRIVAGSFAMVQVSLAAPVELSRGCFTGSIELEDNVFQHGSAKQSDLKRWIRFYKELKSEGMRSGDASLWKMAAINEQEARLRIDGEPFHRIAFHLDGAISRHGTNLVAPIVWLVLQMGFFWALYGISDVLSGRWHAYPDAASLMTSKLLMSVSQTVGPFSAFEVEFMGHPYASGTLDHSLNASTLVLAGLQSLVCLMILASVVLALRHRLLPNS